MTDKLFSPLRIGDYELAHRVVLPPLTRYRAPEQVPGELMTEYFVQRATRGGLLLTEATHISETAGGAPSNPRIDGDVHVKGWEKVTTGVHSKGAIFFMQLNHTGRSALPKYNREQQPVSSSAIKLRGVPTNLPEGEEELQFETPREMTEADMDRVVGEFVHAAKNAMRAGFDGVELHGANGYLLDQFLQDNINQRTDQYGGSMENRCKFVLRVVDEICKEIGSTKVAFRMSPWGNYLDAGDSDPIGNFSYLCSQLEVRGIAYVHIVEARSESNGGKENSESKMDSLDEDLKRTSASLLKKWLPTTPIISAGGWNDTNFQGIVEETGVDALAFGRWYISNPDLVERLRKSYPLAKYDRPTFYAHLEAKGYVDYGVYREETT